MRRICLSLFVFAGVASAHTPHDAIDSLQVSPSYSKDSTLFVIVQNRLLRSTNRGSTWKQLTDGLDSPYLFSDVTVSRHFSTGGGAFVSTDGGGVYASRNGGKSWTPFNTGLHRLDIGKLLVIGDEQDQVILAAGATGGLFASGTAMADWHRVISDDVQVTALIEMMGESDTAVVVGDADGGIWQSGENLKTWQRLYRLPDSGSITAIATAPMESGRSVLFIGTSHAGLLATTDGGMTVENISRHWPAKTRDCRGSLLDVAIPDRYVRDIEVGTLEGGVSSLYVSTSEHAVHFSPDGGATWQTRNAGISCDNQADAPTFAVPHYRDLEQGDSGKRDLFVAGFDGLYRSADYGKSWTALEILPVSLIRGFNTSPAENGSHALAVTTYGAGAYLSYDAGESWSIENSGLVTTRLSDIEFAPTYWDDGRIYSASRARILSRNNPGESWVAKFIGYRGWRRTIGYGLERHFGIGSNYGRRLFLTSIENSIPWAMELELSPNFSADKTIIAGFRRNGIWKSEDAGITWDRNWTGPKGWVTSLEVSPNYAQDKTIFAGIRGAGIYVSRDGSKTWQAINKGIDGFQLFSTGKFANYISDPPLKRAIADVHLAVSPNFATDQTVFAGSAAGLFKTTNGGVHWRKLAVDSSDGNQAVRAVGVSPAFADDSTIVVSLRGKGLYRSVDKGDSFVRLGQSPGDDNIDVSMIRFSPDYTEDGRIYGATEEFLLESDDGGTSWNVINRPIRYEDWRGTSNGPIRFSAEWKREAGPDFSASSQTVSNQPGATAKFNFFGSELIWMGERGPRSGMAIITLDGVYLETVDLFSVNEVSATEIAHLTDLEMKPHSIVIEASAQKNDGSMGNYISLDWLEQPGGSWVEESVEIRQ